MNIDSRMPSPLMKPFAIQRDTQIWQQRLGQILLLLQIIGSALVKKKRETSSVTKT
jgi:hypothetical protein